MNSLADSHDTVELLGRIAQGDEVAKGELLSRHQTQLKRCVARRFAPALQSRLDPSDVVQETQIELIRRLPDFLDRRPMSFRLWVVKTAHQRLAKLERDHLRTSKRQVARELPLPDSSSLGLAQLVTDRGPSPSQAAAQRQIAGLVRRILAELPEQDRAILMMRNFENLSNSDAAAVLELSPAAAKKRYARALERLAQLLRNQLDNEMGRP